MTQKQQISNYDKTHFGFSEVDSSEKSQLVREVFDSVAHKYDLMNDLMSLGMHRLWKKFTISKSAVRTGHKILDIAAGTGDLTKLFKEKVGKTGLVIQSDINFSMLQTGRDQLIDQGILTPALLCNAEQLPFIDNSFDIVSVAFGLRNMTNKAAALEEMQRVLKPGGRLLVLEFSKVTPLLKPLYEQYLFKVIPQLGKIFANDSDSYLYLAESIYVHPNQETLAEMMRDAGLQAVEYFNLNAGVVALHRGIKFI